MQLSPGCFRGDGKQGQWLNRRPQEEGGELWCTFSPLTQSQWPRDLV